MSFILPPVTVTPPSGSPAAGATARQGGKGQDEPGSFGEALSRSMKPAREAAEKTDTKLATPPGARRPPASKKGDADDLVNAMALALPPLETRTARVAPAGSTGTVSNSTPAAAGATLPELLASSAAIPAEAQAAAAPAPDAGMGADTDVAIALQPLLASAGQKDSAQSALQTRLQTVHQGPAMPIDQEKIAGRPTAADTGTPGQSAGRDDRQAPQLSQPVEAGTGQAPVTSRATTKAAPENTVQPPLEAAVNSRAASHAAIETPVNTGTVLPVNPLNAGVQLSAAVSTPDTPPPTAGASLAPEVGSGEWGKALGQQVVRMGTTGHQLAELQLNPPGLGPLKVTLNMNEHQMQAMFVSAHASVRAAVEAALPQLRTALADNGISLGNTSVSSESQQQAAFAGSQEKPPGGRAYRDDGARETSALPARSAAAPPRRNSGAGLDTYA